MKRALLINLAVGAIGLISGCKVNHQATETVRMESIRKSQQIVNSEVNVTEALKSHENIVMENPEIVLHDSITQRKITIKGERLLRGKDCIKEVERQLQTVSDSTTVGETKIKSSDRSSTELKAPMTPWYIVIAAAVAWWAIRAKKR